MEPSIEPTRCRAKLISNQKKQCSRKKTLGCNFCGIHQKIWTNRGLNTVNTQVNKLQPSRIYNPASIIKIQGFVRGVKVRRNINTRGFAVYARHLCTNAIDCYELENIHTIPNIDFISYRDSGTLYWGFHIKTMQRLLEYSSPNPYNLVEFPTTLKPRFTMLRLKKPTPTPKLIHLSPRESVQQFCIEVFQKIDSLNNYTKCSWFLNLNIIELKNLYYFLLDLWGYRLNLSIQDKKKYISNMPLFDIKYEVIKTYNNYYRVANIILNIFNKLVTEGEETSDRVTACNWILSALTLVSVDARVAFPWLYQAAHPTLNV